MAESILIAKELSKYYSVGKNLFETICHPFRQASVVRALDSISLNIESGEILGIVGPNGAGKTTLLRILADLLEPDVGTISLWGQSYCAKKHTLRRTIGYVSSDERSFFWRLSGRHNLECFSTLWQHSRVPLCWAAIAYGYIIAEILVQCLNRYSTGMRKSL